MAASSKRIEVSLSRKRLTYFEDDEEVDWFHCVIGADNKTKKGTFSVLLKDKDKVSRKYGAPMPWSLKFSSDYKAIHGTGFALVRSFAQWAGVDSVGSHGCVGLSNDNAETLYKWADVGTPIIIKK